jgi:dihydrolipoamide dehydrogenase
MLKTKTVVASAEAGRHPPRHVRGAEGAGTEGVTTACCRPSAAAQRQAIGADKAGVTVTDRGFIPVDKQMRTNVPHIFAIGDIVGQPMLAHKAVHEARSRPKSPRRHKARLRRARDPERGLHRSRSRLGRC